MESQRNHLKLHKDSIFLCLIYRLRIKIQSQKETQIYAKLIRILSLTYSSLCRWKANLKAWQNNNVNKLDIKLEKRRKSLQCWIGHFARNHVMIALNSLRRFNSLIGGIFHSCGVLFMIGVWGASGEVWIEKLFAWEQQSKHTKRYFNKKKTLLNRKTHTEIFVRSNQFIFIFIVYVVFYIETCLSAKTCIVLL